MICAGAISGFRKGCSWLLWLAGSSCSLTLTLINALFPSVLFGSVHLTTAPLHWDPQGVLRNLLKMSSCYESRIMRFKLTSLTKMIWCHKYIVYRALNIICLKFRTEILFKNMNKCEIIIPSSQNAICLLFVIYTYGHSLRLGNIVIIVENITF